MRNSDDEQILAEQVIIDILKTKMELEDSRIWIRSQNRKIPGDDGLFIVVGMVDSIPYGNTVTEESVEVSEGVESLKESVMVQCVDNIQIDILSRNREAIMRRWEVLAALQTTYAKQKQEELYFRIARIPARFLDASGAEGGSNLNRFSITIPCFVWYRKETVLAQTEIFDSFGTRVDDANTIGEEQGLIEFNIPAEG